MVLRHRSAEGTFEVELIDLLESTSSVQRTASARCQEYEFEYTKKWSETITGRCPGFRHPEYNHSFNAATKNAIDYLHQEWKHKPYGIVSYGSMAWDSAVQALKPIFTAFDSSTAAK